MARRLQMGRRMDQQDDFALEMARRNVRTQISLWIFCGIGILFLGSIVLQLGGMSIFGMFS